MVSGGFTGERGGGEGAEKGGRTTRGGATTNASSIEIAETLGGHPAPHCPISSPQRSQLTLPHSYQEKIRTRSDFCLLKIVESTTVQKVRGGAGWRAERETVAQETTLARLYPVTLYELYLLAGSL